MKLSDVKGERTLEVIAELVEPIANIAEDSDIAAMFKREAAPEGMEAREFFLQRMRKAVPALLKTHNEDVLQILSTIKGVSVDEYAKEMTLASVFGDMYELLTDQEFLSFLSS